MTAATNLRVEMVTPFGAIADVETDAVTAPGRLGEFEVFAGHVPLLTELHTGVLKLGEKTAVSYYAVGPGFLEVTADGLIRILVERAVAAADVEVSEARADLAEAMPELRAWTGDLDAKYATLKARHDWAVACLAARDLS